MNKWVKKHPFAMAIISTFILTVFSIFLHYYKVSPHDWAGVIMWIPIYASPFWAIAGASKLTDKLKNGN